MDNDTPRHSRENIPSGNMPDAFDRMLGNLHGLPDSVRTKPTTLRSVEPIVGHSQTHIVQTIRLREVTEKDGVETARGRDWGFIEAIDRGQVIRLALPPTVMDTIARQRDALTAMTRTKIGKEVAQARKDRGELPGFMKAKKGGRK